MQTDWHFDLPFASLPHFHCSSEIFSSLLSSFLRQLSKALTLAGPELALTITYFLVPRAQAHPETKVTSF